jgi:hypothetical protein
MACQKQLLFKQELNSSETSCDRVGGLIGGVVKKAKKIGLVKKVSFSSLEMRVVKKSISALGKKKVQKVVKKLSKVVKKLSKCVKPRKN